jgi:hypothetical protein
MSHFVDTDGGGLIGHVAMVLSAAAVFDEVKFFNLAEGPQWLTKGTP